MPEIDNRNRFSEPSTFCTLIHSTVPRSHSLTCHLLIEERPLDSPTRCNFVTRLLSALELQPRRQRRPRQVGPPFSLLVHGAFDQGALVPSDATTPANKTTEAQLDQSLSFARPSINCMLPVAPVDLGTGSCSHAVPISADQSQLLKVAEEIEGFVAARTPAICGMRPISSPEPRLYPCLLLSLVITTTILVMLRRTLAKLRSRNSILSLTWRSAIDRRWPTPVRSGDY